MISCTSDNDLIEATNTVNVTPQYAARQGNELPVNPKNTFDGAGEIYYEVLESYFANNNTTLNTAEILHEVNSIAEGNSRFVQFKGSIYLTSVPNVVQPIISNPSGSVPYIIHRTGMSPAAKSSLSSFLQHLGNRCKNDNSYDSIYDFIVSYETNVIDNSAFDVREKQIILTTSSISRFATFRKKRKLKKRFDQDWDWLIAGIAAGTDGVAEFSFGNAITMSATVTVAFEQ